MSPDSTSQRPLLSVVIVNWNTGDQLRACLESLHYQPQGARFETIDRAGHFPHLEEPAVLVERISGFIGARKA